MGFVDICCQAPVQIYPKGRESSERQNFSGHGTVFHNILFPNDGWREVRCVVRCGVLLGCGDCGLITCDFISIRETFRVASSTPRDNLHMTHFVNCIPL